MANGQRLIVKKNEISYILTKFHVLNIYPRVVQLHILPLKWDFSLVYLKWDFSSKSGRILYFHIMIDKYF
jgi:hypothetical protein